jgi:hypothetical protein
MVPQDIYTIKHVYDLNEIIRTWHADGKKGLRVEVVVTLTEKPVLETTLTYASPYSLGVKSLQRVLLASILLLNILKASIPKKKGNISATVAQRLALPKNILVEVLLGNLAPLVAFRWPY